VRVGGDGGLVGSGRLEVDESAVLYTIVSLIQGNLVDLSYLAAADVEILDLAILGESSPQCAFLDLAVHILDVGALLVSINGRRLVLCARLLLLVAGCGLPARGLVLASGGRLVAGRSCSLGSGRS
jgi:hypothetical protein